MDAQVPQEETVETKPKRTRRFKKRLRFQVPKPAVAVKALWEQASEEERQRAHKTCVLMLEHWLGRKTKAEMVETLGLPPLRVWQLSQSALSGMLAGLLKQPKNRRRGRPPSEETSEVAALRKENAALRKENEALRTVNELLKDLPLIRESKDRPEKTKGGKKPRRAAVRRTDPTDPGTAAP
jgi:hypothetical protein